MLTRRVLCCVSLAAAAAAFLAAAKRPCVAAGCAGACISTALLPKRREGGVVALVGERTHVEDQHVSFNVPGLCGEG